MRKILQKNPKDLLAVHQNAIKRSGSSSPRPDFTKHNQHLLREIRNILQSYNWEDTLPFSKVPRDLNPHVIQVLLRENQWLIQSNSKKMTMLAITLCNYNMYGCVSLIIDSMISIGLSPISILGSFLNCYKENFDSRYFNLNPKVFEVIVDRYRIKGLLDEAAEILLSSDQFVPSPPFFNSLLKYLLNRKKLELFWKVCETMSRKTGIFDVYGYTNMIKAHCMVGNIKEAKRVFIKMGEEGCNPSFVTYNVIIGGLCKSGLLDEAIAIKKSMIEKGLVPNVFIYTTLINGFCMMKRSEEAKLVLKEMIGAGVDPTMVTYNALVNGLVSEGGLEAALRVKDEMVASRDGPNLVVYNTILHGLCGVEKMEEARLLMNEMMESGLEPNTHTFAAFINGYCRLRELIVANKYFYVMVGRGLMPRGAIYAVLIEENCRSGNVTDAFSIFRCMISKKGFSDTWTYKVHLDCLMKYGKFEEVSGLLVEFHDKGFVLDLSMFDSLVLGLCKKGKVEEAYKLVQDGVITPSLFTYNILIKGFFKIGDTERAKEMFDEIKEKDLIPNDITYGTLIIGLCKSKDLTYAYGLLDEMVQKGVPPNCFLYNAVVDCCYKIGDLEKAKELSRQMTEKGIALTSSFDVLTSKDQEPERSQMGIL